MSEKKTRKNKQSKFYIVEAVIVIGLALGTCIYSMVRSASGIVDETNAVEIDGEKYSVSDVNYFFCSYYDSYRKQNSEYISYMFDETRSLKEQEYEDGISWFSWFLDESIDSMTSVIRVSKAAHEDGFELDEASREEIQTYLDGISLAAENSGVEPDTYVSGIYGKDMTLDRYEELLTMSFVARDYAVYKQDGFRYSDDDIEQYYEDHMNSYIFASYERLYFKAAGYDEEADEEQREEARELAEEALSMVREGRELKDVAGEYEDAVYYSTEDAYYSEGYSYGDWLFSEERKAGDSELIDDGNGFYVMVFRDRARHDYPAVNIRDIYFVIDPADGNLDELYEESCTKAEDTLEEWMESGGTEELFAELADEKAPVEGHEGGLYENLLKDTADSNVEKWSFDESREPGDCEVVYSEGGFHVLYFSGEGDPSWKVEAESDLREEELKNLLADIIKGARVDRHEKALDKVISKMS